MELPYDSPDGCFSLIEKGKGIWIPLLALVFGLIFVHASGQVWAAEWTLAPSLEVSETYLDNVTLAPPGDEESDYITQITPEILAHAKGRRGELDLAYRMQNLLYVNNSQANTTYHQLVANTTAELVREVLFIDADGSYGQAPISQEGAVGFDNLAVTENRTNVGTYSISPYLLKQFGRFASAELRYTYEKVEYSEDTASVADSDGHRIFAQLGSSRTSQRLTPGYRPNQVSPSRQYSTPLDWSLIYQRDESNNRDGADTKFEETVLQLHYRLGAETALRADLGYEDNEYERSPDSEEPKGLFWSVGMVWNPSRRTSLEATTGERFYGQHYDLAFRHQTRRTTVEVLYLEETINPSGALLESPFSLVGDELGSPVPDPSGELQPVEVPLPSIGTEVYLRKRLTANISKSTAKSIFRMEVFNEERDYQATGDEERVYGGNAVWDWRLAPRTSSMLRGDWQRQELRNGEEDELWQISLRVTRKVRANVDGFLEYRHVRQQSTEAENEYRQNSIAAGVRIQF